MEISVSRLDSEGARPLGCVRKVGQMARTDGGCCIQGSRHCRDAQCPCPTPLGVQVVLYARVGRGGRNAPPDCVGQDDRAGRGGPSACPQAHDGPYVGHGPSGQDDDLYRVDVGVLRVDHKLDARRLRGSDSGFRLDGHLRGKKLHIHHHCSQGGIPLSFRVPGNAVLLDGSKIPLPHHVSLHLQARSCCLDVSASDRQSHGQVTAGNGEGVAVVVPLARGEVVLVLRVSVRYVWSNRCDGDGEFQRQEAPLEVFHLGVLCHHLLLSLVENVLVLPHEEDPPILLRLPCGVSQDAMTSEREDQAVFPREAFLMADVLLVLVDVVWSLVDGLGWGRSCEESFYLSCGEVL